MPGLIDKIEKKFEIEGELQKRLAIIGCFLFSCLKACGLPLFFLLYGAVFIINRMGWPFHALGKLSDACRETFVEEVKRGKVKKK